MKTDSRKFGSRFKPLLLIASGAVLASCATGQRRNAQTPTYTLPPNCVVADEIPMESTIGVRSPDTVKAYPVGRYVDPVNKNVMHERTVIYRVEAGAKWKLRAQPDPVQLGPVAGLRSPNYVQGPIPSELKSELAWQKAATERVMTLAKNLQGVDTLTSTAQKIVANQRLVLQTLQSNQADVQKLQKRIEEVAKNQGTSQNSAVAEKLVSPIPSVPVKSGTSEPNPGDGMQKATAGFKVPESNFLLKR